MTDQSTDLDALVERLWSLHDKAERGVSYGYEQSIWRDTAAAIVALRGELAEREKELERECDDADRLLVGLGLTVEECRTEGGSLNVARIITKLSEIRVDKAIAERIDAALAAQGEKPTDG